MKTTSGMKSFRQRCTALLLSLLTAAAFAPSAFAESPSDISPAPRAVSAESSFAQSRLTAQDEENDNTDDTQADNTQADDAQADNTQADSTRDKNTQDKNTQTGIIQNTAARSVSGSGFENVETDGGTMLVGTARIPKENGPYATVKFIYSSGINLNDKSLKLISEELSACGITVPDGMIYVSRSDIVSDSQLMTQTSERQAVFACGSEQSPTVLQAYPPYESVEESFEHLFRGYLFSISGYSSLKSVFDGRSEITLSDDGLTASTSIVMSEDYVEKVINGKTVKILMINSELKYWFRAPKLVFEKDENYVSDSDTVYHYPTHTTTTATTTVYIDPALQDPADRVTADSDTTATTVPLDNDTDASATTATGAAPDDTSSETEDIPDSTATSRDDADDEPSGTSDTPSTTTTESFDWEDTTTGSYSESTTISANASPVATEASRQSSTTTQTTTAASRTRTTTEDDDGSATTQPSLRTTTTHNQTTDSMFDYTTMPNTLSLRRGYVSTRRLPLNVRSGPGMKYMVVTVLPKGTYVTVLDTSNPNWYMIKTMNGVVGYAYSKYITVS